MKKLLPILLALTLLLTGCKSARIIEQARGAENYNVTHLVSAYHGDLDSNLSVFPDFVESRDASYEATVTEGLFDIDAVIILECRYEDYLFEAELRRLKTISLTIKSGWHKYTNHVLYDADSYALPAYVTIDGFGSTYEYALVDEESLRIVYVYLSYPDPGKFPRPELLKKDLSLYGRQDPTKGFSLYNHAFYKGEWTEFDDVEARDKDRYR